MPTHRAMQLSIEQGLDLVEVNPTTEPPVCKIMDYGSYQYQQEKRERKHKAKQKKVEVKGIRLSLKIGPHDLEFRKNQALKFFEKGHRVKIELLLRGREREHNRRAREIMAAFVQSLGSPETILTEKPISQLGGKLFLIVGKK